MGGTGSLSANDKNTFRGGLTIKSGTVLIGANGALGGTSGTGSVLLGDTTGTANARLLMNGAFTAANPVTIQSGNTGVMTIGGDSADASIFSGAINLGTASGAAKNGTFVALSGGSVDFQGVINESSSVPDSSVVIGDATHSGVVRFSNASNQYGGTTTITNGATLEVVALGNSGGSSIGNSTRSTASNLVLSNGTLKYIGTGETTGRSFTVDANGGALDASGSGAITFTGSMAASSTGNRTLTLTGTNTGANTLQTAIVNPGSGTTSLTKSGAGSWTLTGANTFNGPAVINGGILTLARSGGPAFAGNSTVTVNSGGTLLMGGHNQINQATFPGITLNGGTLDGGGFSQGTGGTSIANPAPRASAH